MEGPHLTQEPSRLPIQVFLQEPIEPLHDPCLASVEQAELFSKGRPCPDLRREILGVMRRLPAEVLDDPGQAGARPRMVVSKLLEELAHRPGGRHGDETGDARRRGTLRFQEIVETLDGSPVDEFHGARYTR